MSLTAKIAAHDDAALEGLASKGVLRRARRDLENGRAEVSAQDSAHATVVADGQTVVVDERGPSSAVCTCSAAGICRHIVLAILALRESDDQAEPINQSARDEVCRLTEAALQKFAGADWSRAITIAASDELVTVDDVGQSIVVALPELDASVTFIAGQGLKEAAYKGARTRKRLLTTVAAVAVRAQSGVSADVSRQEATRPAIAGGFIDDAQSVIERAVAAVIPGRSAMAYDLLLDLAISTRAEALPRLSAELRGLARQARFAHRRDVHFEASQFLRHAARSYALCEALRTGGDDSVLTGIVRRDYQPRDALTLWLLGASKWRSASGAKGATCHGYSPAENCWFTVSDGRAAGTDPGFVASTAYCSSLWGSGTMEALIGHEVTLPGPQAAADHSLSLHSYSQPAQSGASLDVRAVLGSDAAFDDWDALQRHVSGCSGEGLQRRVRPIAAVLVPRRFVGFGFNDVEQIYEIEVADVSRNSIVMSIPGSEHDAALYLKRSARKIKALLVESGLTANGPVYRPITAYQASRSSIECINLDFDDWPYRPALNAMDRISDFLLGSREPAARSVDPLVAMMTDVLDGLVAKVGRSGAVDIGALKARSELAGFAALAAALDVVKSSDAIEAALKAAYAATEMESILLAHG